MKPKYQHQLFIEGLEYLERLCTDSAVALDIETTGLDPQEPTKQVTQVAVVPTDTSLAQLNEKAGLTADVVTELCMESNKEPGALSKGSLHWVLRYNHYKDGLFSTYGERSGGILQGGFVRVEKSTTVSTTIGRQDQSATHTTLDVWTVPADSEVPLDDKGMECLLAYSARLPSEAAVLCATYDRLHPEGLRYIIGQHVIDFDCTFLQARWQHVPAKERANRSRILVPEGVKCIDTMWITRVLLLPALSVLGNRGMLSEADAVVYSHLLSKGRRGRASSHLQDLRTAFSIVGGTAHDAAGDCATNISVLESIKGLGTRYLGPMRANAEAQEEFRKLSFLASICAD